MTFDELNVKFLVLGAGNIGKTSLSTYYTNEPVPERYMPTIGSNIYNKIFEIEQNDVLLKVNVWDIGGQRSFNPLNPLFYKNADIALLVFDLSRPEETIKSIFDYHLKNLNKYAPESIRFIIGNKLDLVEDSDSLKDKIDSFSQEYEVLGFSSAKKGIRVKDIFNWAIYQFLCEFEKELGKNEEQYQISNLFLDKIGKSEAELSELLSNPYDFDTHKKQEEVSTRIKKGIKLEQSKKGITIEKYHDLKEKLDNYEGLKGEIMRDFNLNLNKIEKVLTKLSKTPIDQLMTSIQETHNELTNIKKEFADNLDSILALNEKSEFKS